MNADLLRRAAALLRNPFLCNWDDAVAHALAGALDAADHRAQHLTGLSQSGALDAAMVDVARALLWAFGHTCGDDPGPCSSCALRVPTPEEAP